MITLIKVLDQVCQKGSKEILLIFGKEVSSESIDHFLKKASSQKNYVPTGTEESLFLPMTVDCLGNCMMYWWETDSIKHSELSEQFQPF